MRRKFLFLILTVGIVEILLNVAYMLRSSVTSKLVDYPLDSSQEPPTGVHYVQPHGQPLEHAQSIGHRLEINPLKCPDMQRPKDTDIKMLRSVWQVQKLETVLVYIYSAFYDDRPAVGFLPVVRVITMSTFTRDPIYCHIWYESLSEPYVVNATVNETGINRYTFAGLSHREYTYTCPLTVAHPVPTHVSVSILKICAQKLTNFEPIHYVPRQEPPIEFGVCVTNGYGNHPAHEIVEWIEIQRLYGVEEFNLYDSMYRNMSKVFNHYTDKGLLTVYNLPHPRGVKDQWYQKMRNLRTTALNDCMLRNIYRYRYMIILDLDEIIVPRHHLKYSQVLDKIDLRLNLTKRFHSYSFVNVYFFREFEQFTNETLRSLKYRYRSRHNGEFFGSKSFVSPLCCFNAFNHYCWTLLPTYSKITVFSPPVIAASHHYRKCGFKNETCQGMYRSKTLDNVMLKIKAQVKEKVNPVLEELGESSFMID